MQTATAAGEQPAVKGLAPPKTSDGDPIYPRPRRIAISRAVTGQKVADREAELHPSEAFYFPLLASFIFFSPPTTTPRHFVSFVRTRFGFRPGFAWTRDVAKPPQTADSPCRARAVSCGDSCAGAAFPGPTLPTMKSLVTGCDVLRIGPESMTVQRLHWAYPFLSGV